MKIRLKDVIINNFLSYGHSEIQLSDRGYCLVSGINRCTKDNATSNGSGKSSWSSAICWALTGETAQGLKSGIKNIYADKEADCYVKLVFDVDNDSYEITRYKDGKTGSDLKIKLNGNDISGKGIKESEAILEQYLPDLTSELIGSVIILGQGLPYKFSNNTPSGRKDVLEKLSKSEFMIEDIKERISLRSNKLNSDIRTCEDTVLTNKSKLSVYQSQLNTALNELNELLKPVDFDTQITEIETKIFNLNNNITTCESNISLYEDKQKQLNESLNKIYSVKNDEYKVFSNEHYSLLDDKKNESSKLYANINSLQQEIRKLKSIKDVCPTCGRPFEGVVKPDTTKLEDELKKCNEDYSVINDEINKLKLDFQKKSEELDNTYNLKTRDIQNELTTVSSKINTDKAYKRTEESNLLVYTNKLNKLKIDKENHIKNIEDKKNIVKGLKINIEAINKTLLDLNKDLEKLNEHLEVINKMNTLVKRDFRGFLLSNVIEFIDKKSKEYSKDIFGSDELSFILEGNNINITYCNKPFENLSGGEKQKVDLIIQFAIRDMMSQYLDFSANILVLDEITDNLDTIGCNNVLNLISKKLNDIESIFIVSHRSEELCIPYDSELTVIKNEEGVSTIK